MSGTFVERVEYVFKSGAEDAYGDCVRLCNAVEQCGAAEQIPREAFQ